MAFNQQVQQVWLKEIGSQNIKIGRIPWTSGASNIITGVSITTGAFPAYSAWTQIIAAAKIATPSWLCGIFAENPTNPGAAEVWGIDVATGAGGSEVSLSSGTNFAQGIVSFTSAWISSVGSAAIPGPLPVPFPIQLNAQPRLSAAAAGLLVGGKAVLVALQLATGVGT